jgi:hypothetical protein
VADLSPIAPRVNGLPCKDRANVTSKDFLFTGFRKAGPILNLELLRNGYKYYANNKLVKNLARLLCYVISRAGQLPCNIVAFYTKWKNTVDVTSSLAPSLDTRMSVRKSAHSDRPLINQKTFSTNCTSWIMINLKTHSLIYCNYLAFNTMNPNSERYLEFQGISPSQVPTRSQPWEMYTSTQH